MARCVDTWAGRKLSGDARTLSAACAQLNAQIMLEGSASVNVFYDFMGAEPSQVGDSHGWTDSGVQIRFSSDLDDNLKPVLVFFFSPTPEPIQR